MKIFRIRGKLCALALVGLVYGGGTLAAEQDEVTCLPASDKVSANELTDFSADPQKLLAANPVGGLALSESVRGITASSSKMLDKIIALAKSSNEGQRSAIAAGLARAVAACGLIGTQPAINYGDSIQAAIAASSDPALIAAFQSAKKDVEVASVGPGSSSFGGGSTAANNGQDGAANGYKSPGDGPLDTTSGTYSADYVNSYGDSSTATSNSAFGQ